MSETDSATDQSGKRFDSLLDRQSSASLAALLATEARVGVAAAAGWPRGPLTGDDDDDDDADSSDGAASKR